MTGRRPQALVTGATRGIGRGIAQRLAADGYDLLLAARDADALRDTARELEGGGIRVECRSTDLSDAGQISRLVEHQFGIGRELDVLVLAAGVGFAGPIGSNPLRRFDLQVAVNLRSAFQLVQGLLPALRAGAADRPASGAKVVALASITGVAAEPGLAAYGATKAALISLCESITVEEADNGVSACAISPGYVDTDMSTWMHDRLDPNHMIAVDDVAELVLAVCHLSRYAVVPNIVLTRPGASLWRA